MDEDVHNIPYERARGMFEGAASSVQFDQISAKILAQSVWHLENRGLKGVQLGLLWLMLAKDLTPEDRRGRSLEDGTLSIPCPATAAIKLAGYFEDNLRVGASCTIWGPASALLAVPFIQGFVHEHGFDVKLESHGEELTYGKQGVMAPGGFPMQLLWVDTKCTQASRYTLVDKMSDEPEAYDIPFRRRKTLPVPKARLNTNYSRIVL